MKISIEKSRLAGSVTTPPSKSYTIRALVAAALAKGKSQIINPLSSDDTEATRDVLSNMGIGINSGKGQWNIAGGHFSKQNANLFCCDSAATIRFLTAICAAIPGRWRLVPGQSLSQRPIEPLLEALAQLGADCQLDGNAVIVNGGNLKGGTVNMAGDISSQFISALLLVSPLADSTITINLTTPPESVPYLEMTLDTMKHFGVEVSAKADMRQFEIKPQKYRPAVYNIEGDWSSASYFLALSAVSGPLAIYNLNPDSFQGDKIMINLLQAMGAKIAKEGTAICVTSSGLKAIEADLTNCIDLLPTVAVLAALANGQSKLNGISRARLKESNRVLSVKDGLNRLGIEVTEEKDSLIINGDRPAGGIIDSYGDHRIAMAFSILGIASGGISIKGAECVAKTYPAFWEILRGIGGKFNSDS